MLKKLKTLLQHRWLDASHARRAVPADMAQRLGERVAASERRHGGEVRICVEAALPLSYLWRHFWRGQSMRDVAHQRALSLFGKLRVWDTERNSGVLIYLLLAERSIELVADRGLNAWVAPAQWQALVVRLGHDVRAGRVEQGLALALDEVSALLERHFPLVPGESRCNELPNAPLLL